MNLSKSIIIIDKSVLGVSGCCCLQALGGLSETLQGIRGCEACPRAWNTPAGRKWMHGLAPGGDVVQWRGRYELCLCLNQRHQGVKCFAHSWIWAQSPPPNTLAQAAQKLVGRWADNQVTLFCTKCYRTKDRSNWLCGGDKGQKFPRDEYCKRFTR